ncbi:LAGLIDADG family homing endonuclease [Clostridium lundense]|uniref:LAGLIDADG family homing endonuclease n=1 Tax=Clostridium lundense TaxID=319475 RepID=UPI0004823109|nr:LAGLIDADG family homing endonuclease [Clostridium lundense]
MTSEETAYIAGIIDGEGSIMLIKFHNNQFPAPCISISSTSMELLKWIKHKLNTGTIKSKRNYNPDKHKNSYTYELKYNDAIELLTWIYPYLIINEKKERAIIIINEYKKVTPRNGRYSKEMLQAKELFYERFMKIR